MILFLLLKKTVVCMVIVKKKYSQGKGFQKHFSPICFTIAFKKKLVEWEIFKKNGKTL